jgi:hypothetical protein
VRKLGLCWTFVYSKILRHVFYGGSAILYIISLDY